MGRPAAPASVLSIRPPVRWNGPTALVKARSSARTTGANGVVVVCAGNSVYEENAATGSQLFSYVLPGAGNCWSGASIANGSIFADDGGGDVVQLTPMSSQRDDAHEAERRPCTRTLRGSSEHSRLRGEIESALGSGKSYFVIRRPRVVSWLRSAACCDGFLRLSRSGMGGSGRLRPQRRRRGWGSAPSETSSWRRPSDHAGGTGTGRSDGSEITVVIPPGVFPNDELVEVTAASPNCASWPGHKLIVGFTIADSINGKPQDAYSGDVQVIIVNPSISADSRLVSGQCKPLGGAVVNSGSIRTLLRYNSTVAIVSSSSIRCRAAVTAASK